MLAQIVLDQNFSHYTNLDVISGKVVIKIPGTSSTNISSIVAKLEGESRTRLVPPPNPNGERQRPQLEFHKILYKVQIVFPPRNVLEDKAITIIAGKTTFTLPPGQHEYPFSFKLPFNSDCSATPSTNPTVSLFGGLNVDVTKAPLKHIKRTLPPTLTGFPGEAEIRYYMKVTVNRPNLFKENARAYVPFNFCPIEPPRPPLTDAQVFARRRHEFFNPNRYERMQSKSLMRNLLGKDKRAPDHPPRPDAPAVMIDMRLPEPAILTCAREIPLRILVTSSNGVKDHLSLQSLQIELVSITNVRAQQVGRTEQSSTVIMSRSNIGAPIRFAQDSNETAIDSQLWRGQILPNTVPPSFETCNINRVYELVARVGIKYEAPGFHSQYTTADLRLPVRIFSGVAIPEGMIKAMAKSRSQQRPSNGHEAAPPLPSHKPVTGRAAASSQSPIYAPGESNEEAPPLYSELPPSYEDAAEQNITLSPADGIRREYAPPVTAEDPLLSRDEKS